MKKELLKAYLDKQADDANKLIENIKSQLDSGSNFTISVANLLSRRKIETWLNDNDVKYTYGEGNINVKSPIAERLAEIRQFIRRINSYNDGDSKSPKIIILAPKDMEDNWDIYKPYLDDIYGNDYKIELLINTVILTKIIVDEGSK